MSFNSCLLPGARKSLVGDEKIAIEKPQSEDENNSAAEVLSPFDKRKRGTPNEKRIHLTPRPQKLKDNARKSQERQARKSYQEENLDNFDSNPISSKDFKLKESDRERSTSGKVLQKSKPQNRARSSFDTLPASSEYVEENVDTYAEKSWKAPFLQAAATYQLATKYKELDTFESIFDEEVN